MGYAFVGLIFRPYILHGSILAGADRRPPEDCLMILARGCGEYRMHGTDRTHGVRRKLYAKVLPCPWQGSVDWETDYFNILQVCFLAPVFQLLHNLFNILRFFFGADKEGVGGVYDG